MTLPETESASTLVALGNATVSVPFGGARSALHVRRGVTRTSRSAPDGARESTNSPESGDGPTETSWVCAPMRSDDESCQLPGWPHPSTNLVPERERIAKSALNSPPLVCSERTSTRAPRASRCGPIELQSPRRSEKTPDAPVRRQSAPTTGSPEGPEARALNDRGAHARPADESAISRAVTSVCQAAAADCAERTRPPDLSSRRANTRPAVPAERDATSPWTGDAAVHVRPFCVVANAE